MEAPILLPEGRERRRYSVAHVSPGISSEELKSRLTANAFIEPMMGSTPNDLWGHGKIRADAALEQTPSLPLGTPPVPVAELRWLTPEELELSRLTPGTRVRMDFDYDGDYDLGPFDGNGPVRLPAPSDLAPYLKLELANSDGQLTSLLLAVPTRPDPVVPMEPPVVVPPVMDPQPVAPQPIEETQGCSSTKPSFDGAALWLVLLVGQGRRRSAV